MSSVASLRAVFVVLAAGSGRRYGAYKPMVRLAGRPLIYWSLKQLIKQSRFIENVVLALPPGRSWLRFEREGAVPQGFPWRPIVAPGGETRFDSLRNCLQALGQSAAAQSAGLAFVHDAARPLWPSAWIPKMLRLLRAHPSACGAVPLVPVRETVKSVNGRLSTLEGRENLRLSQTPQLVRLADFSSALRRLAPRKNFLDEAQVLELSGSRVLPFEGHPGNIKVTYPLDQTMLEGLLHAHRAGI